MPRKDDYHGYLRHLSRDAAESSSGTGVHASSQANHLNSRYGRRRGMPRRGTSTAPSRTLADLACLLCCLGICTSGVWFLGSAAYHFFATPLESEPGPPQVSLLPSPPQQSGAGAFQLLPSSDAERARAASLEVLKSAFAARGLPVPSDGALASSASDSSSSLAYPPLPHSYHELLPQFGGAAQEAEEEEAPPEPTPQPTGATVCIPPTQGYNLQGLGRRRRKAGKGGGSPAAAAAAALIDARISGATGASNASSSDSKWAPVGEQPQHVGSSEILEDARAAGSKQNGIVGFDAEPPPLYTRLRLAGLRNSGRRTVEEMVKLHYNCCRQLAHCEPSSYFSCALRIGIAASLRVLCRGRWRQAAHLRAGWQNSLVPSVRKLGHGSWRYCAHMAGTSTLHKRKINLFLLRQFFFFCLVLFPSKATTVSFSFNLLLFVGGNALFDTKTSGEVRGAGMVLHGFPTRNLRHCYGPAHQEGQGQPSRFHCRLASRPQ